MFRRTILCAVLFLVLTGTVTLAFRMHPATADDGPLEFTMTAEKTNYSLGEQVNLTLVVTNISNETINFERSAWSFDFTVYNDTSFLYRWTRFRIFPMIIIDWSLDPGQNITEVLTWPQTCNTTGNSQDFPVSAGTYYIVGGFWGPPYGLQTAPIQVNIFNLLLSLIPSKTVIGQGYNLPLNVIIENLNDTSEDFDVTLFSNTTTIGFKIDTNITRGTSTFQFTWDTSSSRIGNYNLTVQAGNMSAASSVNLTIPGDINGDFKVDLTDLLELALAYGSHPGETKWNPNADIDGNQAISLTDLIILATHYGQHIPTT